MMPRATFRFVVRVGDIMPCSDALSKAEKAHMFQSSIVWQEHHLLVNLSLVTQ